jgi:glycosyltransferase involved in cell wall biosynthesis
MVHNSLKVSIITVVLNNVQHIENCINSVLKQSYGNIEYIIIDGGSTDGTIDLIKKYEKQISRLVSEPDRGIYDAMHKGVMKASGDIIGILNSDDMYADEKVIGKVVGCFLDTYTDTCYGDLAYVDRNDINKTIRYWKSNSYIKENFRRGWMPPHPTFFVKRNIYQQYGMFNPDFPLAADYELMLRLLYVKDVSTAYIPACLVKMRTGGRSHPGLLNTCKNIVENYHAWKVNGLKANPLTFLMKPLFKTLQYVRTKT